MVTSVSPTSEAVAILGPVYDLLKDCDVIEISMNADDDVWVSRFACRSRREASWDAASAERLIRWCVSSAGGIIDSSQPIASMTVPGFNHRIEALLPPVVKAPVFSIRRHTEVTVKLDHFDWFDSDDMGRIARAFSAQRRNIVVSGATGSGKTTFANACLAILAEYRDDERLVVIEDTPELRSRLRNTVYLRTSRTVDQQRLLISTLRLAPDRIVVGECRDGRAALTLLKAWNTGHQGGLTTLHANAASEVVSRLAMLCSEVAVTSQEKLIRSTVDLVVFLDRGAGRPVVREVLEVRA